MTRAEIIADFAGIIDRRGDAWHVSVSRPIFARRHADVDVWHAARLVVNLWSGEPTNQFVPADPEWIRATFGRRRRWRRRFTVAGVAWWALVAGSLFFWLRSIL